MSAREVRTAMLMARVLGAGASLLSWLSAGLGINGDWEAVQALCPLALVMLVAASVGLGFGTSEPSS